MKLCRVLCICGLILLTAGWSSFERDKKKADEGDPEKQYDVGMRLAEGDGTEKNPAESRRYLLMSMQNRHLPAAGRIIEEIIRSRSGDESAIFMQAYALIFAAGSDSSACIRICQEFPKTVFVYLDHLTSSGFRESAAKLCKWADLQVELHKSYFRKTCDLRGSDLRKLQESLNKYMITNNLTAALKKATSAKAKNAQKTQNGPQKKGEPQSPPIPPETAMQIAYQASFPYQKMVKPCLLYRNFPAGASIIWFKFDAEANREEANFIGVAEDHVHYSLLLTRNGDSFYFGSEGKPDPVKFQTEFSKYGFTMNRCGLFKITMKRNHADRKKLVREFTGKDPQSENHIQEMKSRIVNDKLNGVDFQITCSRSKEKWDSSERGIAIDFEYERVVAVKPVSGEFLTDTNFVAEAELAAARRYNKTTVTITHKQLEQFFREIRRRNDRISR